MTMGANKAATLAFLTGGGEMGQLIRTKDWSPTAVGPPIHWPQSLRTTVGTCLNAHLPILIWWGSERIMLYNDAYRLLLGDKHPHALGCMGRDIWPEIWDSLGPRLDVVYTRGEADWSENQLLMVNRHGLPEAAYFSYSQSPIYDESDGIGGILCVVTETTNTLLAEQQRQQLDWAGQENGRTRQQVGTNERVLDAIFQQTPLGVGIFRGPEFIVELANPTVCQLWGRTHQQVVDKPLFEALPEATGQGFEELLQGVYKTGIAYKGHELPVTLERHGQLETVYFDFVYDALLNADGSIERTMVVATDVTRAREGRQQIEASEVRLRSLFEQAPVAIAILRGPSFVVELANPGICTLWNRTEAQLLGHPVFAVLTETAGQGFEKLLTGVLQTGVPFVGNELPVPFLRDGQTKTVYVNFVYEPLRDRPDAPITGIVVVGTDVTEQVLTRQQTEQLLVRERELNELKSNFVTLASHEFRTPMGTILSSVSLIGRYNGPDEGDKRERHVQRIKSAVHGLTGLLNDFLSLSQMEESTLHGRPHPLHIITFCQEVIDDMQALIKPYQRVVYTHRSGQPAISLDGQMLKNILVNLLVNASKYSADGKEIELTTAVVGHQLLVTIRDEGIGIPDADKDKLFINFFRARNVNHVEGTGLGLYVVKRYVDLLGGTVSFTSELNSGTVFTIQLPLSPTL